MLSLLSLSSICYVIGIYVYDFLGYLGIPLAIIGITTIVCFLFLKNYGKFVLTAGIFLCLGLCGSFIAQNPKYNDLYPLDNKYVTVTGYVADLPEQNGSNYSYRIKTTKINYSGKEYSLGQIIKVTTDKPFDFGDGVEIKGFLKEFSDRKNHSDFNVKRFYQSRGIFYRMYALEIRQAKDIDIDYSVTYLANLVKSKYSDAIDREFPGDKGAILKAITLGNKKQFSEEFEDLMLKTGITKFFYPAFLHIYLISLLTAIIFRFLRKSYRNFILAVLLLVYAAVNSQSPIFLKSVLIVIIGMIFLRRLKFTYRPDILSLTVLSVCFFNPLYCFDVGFVMSVSTGIILYYMGDIIESWFSFIPFRRIRKFLTFHLVTTVGLLPLIAYYFNGISLYATLLSPVYLFATVCLLILVPVMCMLSPALGLTLFIKGIINRVLWLYTSLPEIIDSLPFSYMWFKSPDFIFIAAFFVTLYILYQLYLKELTKTKNIVAICISAGLWLSVVVNHITSLKDMNITFVNVGQGDGAIVDIIGGETILIDGGGKFGESEYDAGKQIFAPYLADNGHFDIDIAIVSHYHSDHCLGVIAAMKSFNVKEVIMPEYGKKNEYRKEIERIAAEKNIKITHVLKGDEINLKSGLGIKILSPSRTRLYKGDENEASIVTELEYNGFRCLFTGDIGVETEKVLSSAVSDCDIVKMAHHGSSNSNSKRFADKVKAKYAIVSVGENNSYGFPKEEAVYNYQQSGAKVIRTDINGDITINVNKDGKYKIFCHK